MRPAKPFAATSRNGQAPKVVPLHLGRSASCDSLQARRARARVPKLKASKMAQALDAIKEGSGTVLDNTVLHFVGRNDGRKSRRAEPPNGSSWLKWTRSVTAITKMERRMPRRGITGSPSRDAATRLRLPSPWPSLDQHYGMRAGRPLQNPMDKSMIACRGSSHLTKRGEWCVQRPASRQEPASHEGKHKTA